MAEEKIGAALARRTPGGSLHLGFSKISQLPEAMFSIVDNDELPLLDLRNNQLSQLPEEMVNLIGLKNLILDNNRFQQFPHCLCGLPCLRTIDLSYNRLEEIPHDIGECPVAWSLEKLDVTGNQLATLPLSLGGLTCLQALIANRNQLFSLSAEIRFDQLTNLRVLRLSDNMFETLPDSLGSLLALQVLSLSNNSLHSIPDTLGNLTNLEELDLRNNLLTQVPSSFRSIPLKSLDLSHNRLDYLAPILLNTSTIQTLRISHNNLPLVPPNVTALTSLTKLGLSHNSLLRLPANLAKMKKDFRFLVLSYNPTLSWIHESYGEPHFEIVDTGCGWPNKDDIARAKEDFCQTTTNLSVNSLLNICAQEWLRTRVPHSQEDDAITALHLLLRTDSLLPEEVKERLYKDTEWCTKCTRLFIGNAHRLFATKKVSWDSPTTTYTIRWCFCEPCWLSFKGNERQHFVLNKGLHFNL